MKTKWLLLFFGLTAVIGFVIGQGRENLPEQVARLERELNALKREVSEAVTVKGDPGPQGPAGPKGEKGDPSPKGEKGDQGPAGEGSTPASFEHITMGDGFTLYDNESGTNVAYIGTGAQEGGLVRLKSDSGTNVAEMGATQTGHGYAEVFNNSGGRVVYIGTNTGGNGHARYWNNSGTNVATIGSASNGEGFVEVNGEFVHDYAEVFELADREGVIVGTVMSVSDSGVELVVSTQPYDPQVVGVVGGAGGLTFRNANWDPQAR